MKNFIIQQYLQKNFGPLRNGTVVLDSNRDSNIASLDDGLLLIYTSWSGPGICNLTSILNLLYSAKYAPIITIVDIENISAADQLKFFGQTLEGWGEVFVIRKGTIQKSYLGRDSEKNFRTDFLKDRLLDQ